MSKHLVIIGAHRGIGLSFVEHYLKQGWQVSACCRQQNTAAEASLLTHKFGRLEVYELDVSEPESIKLLVTSLAEQAIDLLINNACHYGTEGLSFGSIDLEEWYIVLEVNTLAPLLITQTLFSRLKRIPLCVLAFISSKAALNSILKSLAIDLRTDGFKCVTLHPGWVKPKWGRM